MIPFAEAQQFVLERVAPFEPVRRPLDEAVGLVLAEAVVVDEDVPPFVNSAVDGYAVRATDVAAATVDQPVVLAVAGEVAAGADPGDLAVATGQAARIMTGAVVPGGADAIVMVEDTERRGADAVAISAAVEPGAAVRGSGSDVKAGTSLFGDGVVITPAVVGVLASVNAVQPLVVPPARVAVLSTGDELVTDGGPLAPGQIRESNLTMLIPALADAGCEVRSFGVVPDDEAKLEAVLREAAAESDAIVTSGGVSMGDYDVVKAVLGRIADMRWMQVAIKPAKPFAFGLLDDGTGRSVPVFGLPGNPVSSLVSFELFARPALRRMMGHHRLARPSTVAIADADLTRRPDGKAHLLRVTATWGDDGRVHVAPVWAQGSHQLAATALANAIAVVDDGDGVPAGDEVAVLLLDRS